MEVWLGLRRVQRQKARQRLAEDMLRVVDLGHALPRSCEPVSIHDAKLSCCAKVEVARQQGDYEPQCPTVSCYFGPPAQLLGTYPPLNEMVLLSEFAYWQPIV